VRNCWNKQGRHDAGDQYVDTDIGLRHQRLSIIDTTDTGLQPMKSPSGRYITVFNGEIYNFQTLRKELVSAGVVFRGHSDTEVLLALYERDGIDCLKLLNGMFALAIWDTKEKSLFLARDRLGKKPLYIWRSGEQLAFASEIKALLQVPGVEKRLRFDAVKDFFTYQYIPDPKSIFQNIEKLAPGHWMLIDQHGETRTEQWWDVSFEQTTQESESDVVEHLHSLIDSSVQLRMISDVPLGAFLSGGVDSSAVVGFMASHSNTPVKTCSIGFDSEEHDETVHARAVAQLFETHHREYRVESDVEQSLAEVARFFDEPFADPSFLPTFFVSRMARQSVTVALAGDGGDESFGGYAKYGTYERELRLKSKVPAFARDSVVPLVVKTLSNFTNSTTQRATNLLRSLSVSNDKGFFICNSFFREDVWQALAKGDLASGTAAYDASEISRQHFNKADTDDPVAQALYTDLKTYLPGDILVKVDRMSMANSLECRAPLLDYRIVEYAASLPMSMKRRDGNSKYVLKKTMAKMLPDEILHRKKMGFDSPVSAWLRGSLRKPFESAVFGNNSASQEMFNLQALRKLWKTHLDGNNSYARELWSIYMFELWWQAYIR